MSYSLINNKSILYIAIALATLLFAYFVIPQSEYVPNSIKKVVNSCAKEGETITSTPNEPQCCLGLTPVSIHSPEEAEKGVLVGSSA